MVNPNGSKAWARSELLLPHNPRNIIEVWRTLSGVFADERSADLQIGIVGQVGPIWRSALLQPSTCRRLTVVLFQCHRAESGVGTGG